MRTLLLAAMAALGLAPGAQALTYAVEGGFSGGKPGQVAFDLRVTGDFRADIDGSAATATGLRVRTLTRNGAAFVPAGGLGYSYRAASDSMSLFGRSGGFGLSAVGEDFGVEIGDFTAAPNILAVFDSVAGPGAAGTGLQAQPGASVRADLVAAVPAPLPAGLLFGSVALLGVLRRRKSG